MNLVDRHRKVYAPTAAWANDIEVVSASGTRVTTVEGREFLDFATGISVLNAGHNHPEIVAAAKAQLDKVWHAAGSFRYDSLVTAAEKIIEISPSSVERLMFMNSGAEAVEASVKLSRNVTGRQGIIVFRGGFHGRTMGAVSLTTSKATYRAGYHPILPSIFVAPFPHPYRWGMTGEEATAYALAELRSVFEHQVLPEEVAAFLVEPQQGEGGYYPAAPGFLEGLRAIADEHGILLVLDEVQSGFGRTGEWFASDHYPIEPDLQVMGKAIANGLPLSALGGRSELFEAWPPGSHGTTFGGNAVACAASAATVDVIRGLLPGVPALADHTVAGFTALQSEHPTIGDIRGLGLMIGIELVYPGTTDPAPEAWAFIKKWAFDHDLLLIACGADANVIRFLPAFVATTEEIDRAISVIGDGIAAWEMKGTK
ncbi:aminotransferase class III-fold pyridoxal phosphate-dependent enzyme [bacterium]|nr:aminotransferase class III-fold pyridoxal phosphate-dependent enzyme [bacterium]